MSDCNPSEWHGILNLTYSQNHGITQVVDKYTTAPYKIQRPFYPPGEEICHSVALHTAGGMVGGDRLSQNLHLKPDTKVLLTTAAASKVYRSTGKTASQNVRIKLEKGAYLEYLPRETIIFNGAIYRQDLRVELAPEATWLGWEITRFGRSARGEKFGQGEWRSHTEIWQNEKPLWIDRQWLPGGETILESPHGLGGWPVVATLAWVGKPVSQDSLNHVRMLWSEHQSEGEAGATQLLSGLLCRYRGPSSQEAIAWFTKIWQLLRPNLSGKNITKPRVWNV
ncbi:MAG: urease accessory protein UreD [Arthrospira sp. SH-MAG29]|nr:urease accessory protein UreD [Arthrospira sp. SH-MAG29]MBS0015833.1 urease accessory protein UreD [Arthrospira sp. SH-MAG29]